MTDASRVFGERDRALLSTGQPLPGDVVDAAGKVLFSKGQPIDEAMLSQVDELARTGLTLGANWPNNAEKPATKTSVTSVTEQQSGAGGKSHEETRGARRYEWKQAITIELEECRDGQSRVRSLEIDTCDISTRGLGFLADGFIYPGTRMYLTFRTLPEKPRVAGEVLYCAYERGGRHRVGVRFLSPAEAIRHARRLNGEQEESEKSAA